MVFKKTETDGENPEKNSYLQSRKEAKYHDLYLTLL